MLDIKYTCEIKLGDEFSLFEILCEHCDILSISIFIVHQKVKNFPTVKFKLAMVNDFRVWHN